MSRVFMKEAWFGLVFLVAGLVTSPAVGDTAAEKIREIVEKRKEVIVKVKFTTEVQGFRGSGQETVRTVPGTLIAKDGLVLLSAGALSPYGALAGMMSNMPGMQRMSEPKTSDFKIVLSDGKEIPAKLLARDKELDLAFVRALPSEKTELVALDLNQNTTAKFGEQIVVVNRLSEGRDYVPTFNLLRINAVVSKPFQFYTVEGIFYGTGLPAFTLEGKLIGFMLKKPEPASSLGQVMGMVGNVQAIMERFMPVLIPIEQILPSVDSARSMGAEDTKGTQRKE